MNKKYVVRLSEEEEREACFLMWGDIAQDFPPALIFAQLVGIDSREDQSGS